MKCEKCGTRLKTLGEHSIYCPNKKCSDYGTFHFTDKVKSALNSIGETHEVAIEFSNGIDEVTQ